MTEVKPEPKTPVNADVKIIPAKRTASYDVALDGMAHLSKKKMTARVNVSGITVTFSEIPKTLEAVDAILALFGAVRAELVEQGIES